MPMIPSESSICNTNLVMFHTLAWILIHACNNENCAKIWTMQASSGHLVFAHDAYRVSHCAVLIRYTIVCLKCIWVPGMCPEPRWIDYPVPRSPGESFAMAGPIRHCLLRACCAVFCQIVSLQYLSRSSHHRLAGLPRRNFLSHGNHVVTSDVRRSSFRRLLCSA